jgi:predicted restriction endonuclease
MEGSIRAIYIEDYDKVMMMSVNEKFLRQKGMLEMESSRKNSRLAESSSYGKSKAKLLDKLFEIRVKNNYKYVCAVCGKRRFSRDNVQS